VPFNSRDEALVKNLYWFIKYNFRRILADKLQQKRVGMLLTENLGNMQHRPKAWDRKTEVHERDHCGRNSRLAKPQRPETNISFNTPDIQRNGTNKV